MGKSFRNLYISRKGSVIVDASIAFPIFLLSIVIIISLIGECIEEKNTYLNLCKKALEYQEDLSYIESDINYLALLEDTKTHEFSISIFYRPFCGESIDSKRDNKTVYIYENYGTKYHNRSCSTIDYKQNYQKTSLKEAEEMGYTECNLCKPGNIDYFKKY